MKTLTISVMAVWAENSKKFAPLRSSFGAPSADWSSGFQQWRTVNFVDAGAEIIITNSYACVLFIWVKEELFAQRGFELAAIWRIS